MNVKILNEGEVSAIRMQCLDSAVRLVEKLNDVSEPVTLTLNIAERFERWVLKKRQL